VNAPDDAPDQGDGPSLAMLLRALIEDAQTLIEAETGYWRTALAFVLARVKTIALVLVLALFFLFFTLMALVVGLLLALAPLIGPWAALALVAGTLALLTAWCAWQGVRSIRRMVRLLTGRAA
jgi:uncharacterized membrane protein YqjE